MTWATPDPPRRSALPRALGWGILCAVFLLSMAVGQVLRLEPPRSPPPATIVLVEGGAAVQVPG